MRIGLNAHFGVGWIAPAEARTGAKSDSAIGYTVGATGFVGRQHRGVLDASYGGIGIEARGIGTVAQMQRTVYGVTGAGGYEFAAANGFLLRICFGVTYAVGELSEFRRIMPALNFSLGYKIF
jgi:hypothetical protein